MKQVLLFLYLLFPGISYAQVNDDFSDSNFTNNPLWTGSNAGADFIISDNKLRSNSNTANATFFLSTVSTLAIGTQWEFWVNLQFSTSSANYTDIYVISDKEDLKAASINGYFIRIGNTDDEISLYKRSGSPGTSIRIIDGVNGSVGSSNNTIKIRLKRNSNGLFTLERELVTAGSSYFTEGTVIDLTHVIGTHFGILIQQSTASFFLKHFFDNIKVEPLVIDNNPPALISVSSIDSTTLEILFSEAMDSLTVKTASNFSISNNVMVAGVSTTSDPAKFLIKLANGLSSRTYNFLVLNVKDRNGNLIAGNSQTFTYLKPYLAKPGDIVINELFADPSPQVGLPLAEFAELRNTTNQRISLKNWKFSDPGSSASLGEINIDPGSFIILCARADTSDFMPFGKTIGLSPWPSLNNANDLLKLIGPGNVIIDSVNYADAWYRDAVKRTGGWTLERKDPKSRCEGFFNWSPSLDTAGGTPGRENSVYTPGTDLLPFYADSLKQLSDSTVRLFFNKPLSSSTLVASGFHLAPSVGILKKITADEELKQVTLLYGAKFKSGTDYQLHISGLTDCSGILISGSEDKLRFRTSRPPAPVPEKPDTAIVHITEIFADPSPEIHLPLVEFVEIYNPSKDTIDLDKWALNDPTTKAIFPKRKILPMEYVILCPTADTLSYIKYGKTIGLNPWPSLNNGSDLISLKSFRNRTVDSVSYSDTWYHNPSKKAGGWSLEKIDLKSDCPDFFNWTASVDTIGGTPGKRNSADLHRAVLKADSLRVLSDTTIKIFFNKPFYEASLLTSNFTLMPGTSIVKRLVSEREAELILTWRTPLQPGISYKLSISNIKDCSGTTLLSTQSLKFRTPSLPVIKSDTGRIMITEIFADPSPEVGLPLAEFVELYNPGTDTIDLSKWILSDAVTKSSIPDRAITPGEYLILCPVADTLSFKPYGKVIGLSPWPALGNSSDQLTIKSFRQRLVDSVAYSDKWYKNQVKKNGGWSLERISMLNASCKGFYNWTSSANPSGGTPGRMNSRHNVFEQIPRIDSLKYTSDSTITISLSAVPDTSFLKPAYFSMNNGLGNAKSLSVSDDYQEIRLRFGSGFKEGIDYLLSADSLFNCSGQRFTTADSQASFRIPVVPELDYPVVINEIFADPSPSAGLPEIEFVELYNPSANTVSLKGMIYGDEGSEYKFTSGHIAPHSYLILCPEKDTLNFVELGKVQGLNVWPVLNNEKDILFLRNNKGRELQKVAYTTSWYKDPEKKTGGYSLEMINPASVCAGIQNWQASRDPSGGTPGKANSVYANSTAEPLKLQHASLVDSIHILLTFNHPVDSLSALEPLNYKINNGVGEPASVTPLAPDFNSILLTLKTAPTRGYTYTIEVQDLRDCTGSIISKEAGRTAFILTRPILKRDILINEILFNPRAGGADFVEIYNNAGHDLDLQQLSIGTIVKDSISSVKKIRATQSLISPGQYFVLTTDPDNIGQEYTIENPNAILNIASLPPFNDNAGTVILMTNNTIIDKLSYTEKMHFQLLKNFEGISLERSRFDIDANAAGNFRSATATAGFATPGYKNSQYSPAASGSEEFALNSRTFSPDNDGFEDLLQVNYKMARPGMVANIKIFDDNGHLIKNLLKNSTLNIHGAFTWDGLNEYNTLPGPGIYIIYAEIFDEDGSVRRFRKSFALAVKL